MIFLCPPVTGGAFHRTPEAQALEDDIREANGCLSDKEVCAFLDVTKSALSLMGQANAGPGVLRFAHMPTKWWVRFLMLRCRRYGLILIEDVALGTFLRRALHCGRRRDTKKDAAA